MDIARLRLTKEEVPIRGTTFTIPIHPRLLEVEIDRTLPFVSFDETIDGWFDEMLGVLDDETISPEKRRWYREEFTSIRLIRELDWKNNHLLAENGFMYYMSINRNAGGTLVYDKQNQSCEGFISLRRFDREKAREFAIEKVDDQTMVRVFTYAQHNVDMLPGALFLRNWALNYMNGALETVAD